MFAAWGDSLTAGAGGTPYPTTLSALQGGALMYNGGVGGETSTQIRTRMLADPGKANRYTLIWVGRNNFTDPTTVKADIAAMVASLTTTKYAVISVTNGDFPIEYAGAADYITMMTLNNDLATTYAGHYVDVRTALVAAYNPALPQDVIDHTNDVPPNSLRADSIHLNTAGYTLVANTINSYILAHP